MALNDHKSHLEMKLHLSPVVLLWFVHHISDRCMPSCKENESVLLKSSKLNKIALFGIFRHFTGPKRGVFEQDIDDAGRAAVLEPTDQMKVANEALFPWWCHGFC